MSKYTIEDALGFSPLPSSFDPFYEEKKKFLEKIDRGLQSGEIVPVSLSIVKNIIMASKGDTIFVLPGRWFIATNVPFNQLMEKFRELFSRTEKKLFNSGELIFKVIKDNPERKFTLVELKGALFITEFTREETEKKVPIENQQELEAEGVVFRIAKFVKHYYKVKGKLSLLFDGSEWKIEERIEKRILSGGKKIVDVDYEVKDENSLLASLIKKHEEMFQRLKGTKKAGNKTTWFFTPTAIIKIHTSLHDHSVSVVSVDAEFPPEEVLFECSRYYTIIVPQFITSLHNHELYFGRFAVYSKGRKYTLALVKGFIEHFYPFMYRITRRRLTISTYMRRILPKGLRIRSEKAYYCTPENKFAEWAKEFADKIREIYEVVKDKKMRREPEVEPILAVLEDICASIPKRKLKVIQKWLEIFSKVKELAPRATLYIVFYGSWRGKPRVPGFKVSKDGTVKPLSFRVFPVSSIVLRGGPFERAYKELYNINRLVSYQLSKRPRKLKLLWEDVERLRSALGEQGIDVAGSDFNTVFQALSKLAEGTEYPDNIILVLFRFSEFLDTKVGFWAVKERVKKALQLLVGLVKTGKQEDFERLAGDILPAIRTAVKYEIKRRGFSIRHGVVFSGDPDTVFRRILEVVKRVKGRVLALLEEEIGGREELLPEEAKTQLGRVKALLKELPSL